jgi:DNA-directed RNA polymerase sigma subunit (sigma70/sigma32)
LNLTRERIRQLEVTALDKMKSGEEEENDLSAFVDWDPHRGDSEP